ncbi:tetratricopeptide repeat protein [Pasteurella skyensis]|uniref:Tetratricopeptide repeat protein n=1 Tax=Phocoenobacter skyensis TaxID=97481 RepID=A0AAJ6P2P6_9PAST|nr:tetratricopeptide repeat protein [Pasteurella skyensis]MDP8170828.1 tetratricopeptide repeat protein [Pasteurella skyensis]MDP8174934.1 tetratricopeptide repeat protein [Pasteurella skyensis]
MYFKKIITIFTILMLSGCVGLKQHSRTAQRLTPDNIFSKEKLYQSTLNYDGLISLYRAVLKNQEDARIRYKLADSYYQKGDSASALLYLQPLLTNPKMMEAAMLLQVKSLVQQRGYHRAVIAANKLIKRFPRNPNVYNARGIALAHLGKLSEAEQDFMKARERFLNDTMALNNLAMLKIINGEYNNAVQLLLPQYLSGQKEQHLIYNLVFALVKSGDTKYALDIIKRERLNTSPEGLVTALKKTQKIPTGLVVR